MSTPLVRAFGAISSTDIAPVAALPTTAAHFCIWNGEAAGGKTYKIKSVGIITTTSAGAVIIVQPIAHVSPSTAIPVISGTVANGPKALDGFGNTSRGVVASAVTITNTGFWHPVGNALISAAMVATIAQGVWTDVSNVGYALPPGGLFSLAVMCSAAGSAKCQLHVTWTEEQL